MACPVCDIPLDRRDTDVGFVYTCRRCGGRATTLPVLRKAGATKEFLASLWARSRDENAPRVRACPFCHRPMPQVEVPGYQFSLTLDVCPRCPAVWFDRTEFEAVPRRPSEPLPAPEPEMSPEAREKLALAELRLQQKHQETMDWDRPPDRTWHWLPGLLGLPVEVGAPRITTTPFVTWAVTAICLLFTLPVLIGDGKDNLISPGGPLLMMDPFIAKWGFIPAEWWRHAGLTMLTSFFLHGGVWHLIGNLYFLLVFGDNVEDRLGHGLFAAVLLAGHLAGMMLHGAFAPDPSIPCVGASAGISSVIAFYALLFPRARLAFLFRAFYFLYLRWFRIPAAWALGLYFVIQILGAISQVKGFGSVSYLGHLGGLAVGLIGAVVYRQYTLYEAEEAVR